MIISTGDNIEILLKLADILIQYLIETDEIIWTRIFKATIHKILRLKLPSETYGLTGIY